MRTRKPQKNNTFATKKAGGVATWCRVLACICLVFTFISFMGNPYRAEIAGDDLAVETAGIDTAEEAGNENVPEQEPSAQPQPAEEQGAAKEEEETGESALNSQEPEEEETAAAEEENKNTGEPDEQKPAEENEKETEAPQKNSQPGQNASPEEEPGAEKEETGEGEESEEQEESEVEPLESELVPTSGNFNGPANSVIQGVVFQDINGNGTQDADNSMETGLNAVRVRLEKETAPGDWQEIGTTHTANMELSEQPAVDGAFEVSGLMAGKYRVTLLLEEGKIQGLNIPAATLTLYPADPQASPISQNFTEAADAQSLAAAFELDGTNKAVLGFAATRDPVPDDNVIDMADPGAKTSDSYTYQFNSRKIAFNRFAKDKTYVLRGTSIAGGNIAIPSEVKKLHLIFDSLVMRDSESYNAFLFECGNDVDLTITLVNQSVLEFKNNTALALGQNAKLTIQGSGRLESICTGEKGAGIGAKNGQPTVTTPSFDSITINSGEIIAVSGTRYGSGIGGACDNRYMGSITINGGTIHATARGNGAGIGSSGDSVTITGPSAKDIVINNATVNAQSLQKGAGIGGGHAPSAQSQLERPDGNIRITNSHITAAAKEGAGIGGGYFIGFYNISIKDSQVNATSSVGGPGIGAGFFSIVNDILLEGSSINATAEGCGAGIGGSNAGRTGPGFSTSVGDITIRGSVVNASGRDAAGIGAGNTLNRNFSYASTSKKIMIQNSTVTARSDASPAAIQSKQFGAGIGSGIFAQAKGDILLEGSTVNIESEGVGIGAGHLAMAQAITITNNCDIKINARRGPSGIGASSAGKCGKITINQTKIDAIVTTDFARGSVIGNGYEFSSGEVEITNSDIIGSFSSMTENAGYYMGLPVLYGNGSLTSNPGNNFVFNGMIMATPAFEAPLKSPSRVDVYNQSGQKIRTIPLNAYPKGLVYTTGQASTTCYFYVYQGNDLVGVFLQDTASKSPEMVSSGGAEAYAKKPIRFYGLSIKPPTFSDVTASQANITSTGNSINANIATFIKGDFILSTTADMSSIVKEIPFSEADFHQASFSKVVTELNSNTRYYCSMRVSVQLLTTEITLHTLVNPDNSFFVTTPVISSFAASDIPKTDVVLSGAVEASLNENPITGVTIMYSTKEDFSSDVVTKTLTRTTAADPASGSYNDVKFKLDLGPITRGHYYAKAIVSNRGATNPGAPTEYLYGNEAAKESGHFRVGMNAITVSVKDQLDTVGVGGTAYPTIDGVKVPGALPDELIVMVVEPAQGYLFAGWDDNLLGMDGNSFTMPDRDVTLVAKMVRKTTLIDITIPKTLLFASTTVDAEGKIISPIHKVTNNSSLIGVNISLHRFKVLDGAGMTMVAYDGQSPPPSTGETLWLNLIRCKQDCTPLQSVNGLTEASTGKTLGSLSVNTSTYLQLGGKYYGSYAGGTKKPVYEILLRFTPE